MQLFNIMNMIYSLPALIIGLTLHELAHGYVAYLLGDNTAKNQGRLSLNPLRHLDPLGAIFLLVFQFGWAKPVPINPLYFRGDRKRGVLLVSLAGPCTNLILAFITAFFWRLLGSVSSGWSMVLYNLFFINLVLAIFNFIPVPPLDGSKILAGILPYRYSHYIYNVERYGILILFLLSFTGIISKIMIPAVQLLAAAIFQLVGMNVM